MRTILSIVMCVSVMVNFDASEQLLDYLILLTNKDEIFLA